MSVQALESDLLMDLATQEQKDVYGGLLYAGLSLGHVGLALGYAGGKYGRPPHPALLGGVPYVGRWI